MSMQAKIYDDQESPGGRAVSDQPDGFLTMAVTHARKSPNRYPLLARVDTAGSTKFFSDEREGLQSEWRMLESLAIGATEKAKWGQVWSALRKPATFQGVEFCGN